MREEFAETPAGRGDVNMYAMRRANGDWFAVEDGGHLRVPVFRSSSAAAEARGRNWGMQLFKPVPLDERALAELTRDGGDCLVSFWLVQNPSVRLSREQPLEYSQLVILVGQSWGQNR